MNVIKKCKHGNFIYNKKDIWIGRSFDVYGEFSEGEVDLFKTLLTEGDFVLDVGANIGAFTIPFAELVGQTGGVFAFEPARTNYYTLCGNVAISNHNNILTFQSAVGKENGSINVPEFSYEYTTNYGGIDLSQVYDEKMCYKVPLMTIDSLNLQRCKLIKIDVEGMEFDVLSGAVETIKKFKPYIYFENHKPEITESILNFLRPLGYIFKHHVVPYFNKNNFAEEKCNIFGNVNSNNIFCAQGVAL